MDGLVINMIAAIQDPVGYHIDVAVIAIGVIGLFAFCAWLFYKNEQQSRQR